MISSNSRKLETKQACSIDCILTSQNVVTGFTKSHECEKVTWKYTPRIYSLERRCKDITHWSDYYNGWCKGVINRPGFFYLIYCENLIWFIWCELYKFVPGWCVTWFLIFDILRKFMLVHLVWITQICHKLVHSLVSSIWYIVKIYFSSSGVNYIKLYPDWCVTWLLLSDILW